MEKKRESRKIRFRVGHVDWRRVATFETFIATFGVDIFGTFGSSKRQKRKGNSFLPSPLKICAGDRQRNDENLLVGALQLI